jgi:tetratricopeptide (TPR) repeat protein
MARNEIGDKNKNSLKNGKGILHPPAQKENPGRKTISKAGNSSTFVNWLPPAIIVLLGILIYSNSFNCAFHFDDISRLVENPGLRNFSAVKAWLSIYPSRPLGMFTFALNFHFNGLDVRYYHLVNIAIHLFTSLLVYRLTLLICSSPALRENPISSQKNVIALFTALLFVSHPLATQSVTYIVQRFNSLAAMFYILSLILFIKARLSAIPGRNRILLYAGSATAALLAMLSKENAVTVFASMLLIEYFLIRTTKLTLNFRDYRVILFIAGLVAVIVVTVVLLSPELFKSVLPSDYSSSSAITPLNYLLTQFGVIVRYLFLLIIPIGQNVDHDIPLVTSIFDTRTILSILVLVGLIILAIKTYKHYRILSFGISWFFITLAIESGIIPISDLMFEHRTYLPSFGFFLILSWGIWALLEKKNRSVAIAVLILLTGINSVLAFERNNVWKTDISLWTDAAAKSPDKARPVYNLGIAHYKAGQMEMAAEDFSKLIAIAPKMETAWSNRGDAYISLGQWENVITDYSKVTELDPNSSMAYYNLGIAYGHTGQADKAVFDYSRAISLDPKNAKAYSNRGVVYSNSGQWDQAIADYSKAIEIDGGYSDAYVNRGIAYYNLKQQDKAIADYSKAIELAPANASSWSNRGAAYAALGQWDKAIADYSKAIDIDPGFRDAWFNRGIAYYNLGQWNYAIADYTRTLEIDPSYGIAQYYLSLAKEKGK